MRVIVGLFLVLGIIINYFITLVKHKDKTFWMWFIVLALIENFTETVFFNAGGLMTLLFIFTYLSLFTNILRKNQIIFEHEMDTVYQK